MKLILTFATLLTFAKLAGPYGWGWDWPATRAMTSSDTILFIVNIALAIGAIYFLRFFILVAIDPLFWKALVALIMVISRGGKHG